MAYIVHKFGGSSLADSEKVNNIANIVQVENEVIVVSALGKTTRKLQEALNLAKNGEDYQSVLTAVRTHHETVIDSFMHGNNEALKNSIYADLKDISRILATIVLTNTYAENLKNFVLGYGELWSARILTQCLQATGADVGFIDASKVLFVDDSTFPAIIDWDTSQEKLFEHIHNNPHTAYVIPGFIAANHEGNRTILGLNCSDFSAAIFARLLSARELYIWTDVAGVFSANPQIVPEAESLERLSYKEALELAYFGASVVHPLTISPMMEENIPIYIKSSLNPDAVGTMITDEPGEKPHAVARGLTSIKEVALVRVQGAGLIGVSSVSSKVFNVLEREHISVLMISQASSEYSLCISIPMAQASRCTRVLEKAFETEIKNGNIEHIRCDKNQAMVTAVGDGMINNPGSSARMIDALAHSQINIHAIAQGSSERSVTVTIKETDEPKALRAIYRAYYARARTIALGIVGAGNIGSQLMGQLARMRTTLYEQGIDLRVLGIARSSVMVLTQGNLAGSDWQQALGGATEKADMEKLAEHLKASGCERAIMVDATASEKVATRYLTFLKRGISVVAANKYANTTDMEYYRQLRRTAVEKQVGYRYETNVCAGLPVIKSIQELIQTGDRPTQVSGVFSGTLSYLFSALNRGESFSQAVQAAYDAGYTEPDPREDLSGMDVARKTICLARELGLNLGLEDLEIENLTPAALRTCSIEQFLKELPAYDQQMAEVMTEKRGEAAGLHYMGVIEDHGCCRVGMVPYASDSPFARTAGTDNLVIISSRRYHDQPLVIQGPGAGASVTAGGMFADILEIVNGKQL